MESDALNVSSTTCCEGLRGIALDFTATLDQHLTLFDADNTPSEGFFVMLTVEFDDLDLGFGDKQSLIAKSDDGGFAPEIKDDVLWARPCAGESTWTASTTGRPRSGRLDTAVSHVLIGTYDGDGRPAWVNNRDSAR